MKPQKGRARVQDDPDGEATVSALVKARAEAHPDRPALCAPGRRPMSSARLAEQVDHLAATLWAVGIDRQDRVAAVLPNGPETAAALLGIMSVSGCAPLNPQYSQAEFTYYLKDLRAKAVVLPAGSRSPAAQAAGRLGLGIFELIPEPEAEAGTCKLAVSLISRAGRRPPARPDDPALFLHTSGTTSRPKLVPLSHSNLVHSARNIARSLGLGPTDTSLLVMPLFHVHGLVGAWLASVAAGAGVVCPGGFDLPRFFEQLAEFRPTWYTAVPTIHQAVLNWARDNPDCYDGGSLRFIRSCSSPLPPALMAGLEDRFQVPVIEAYGMTEASHQIAVNRLPPGQRKPGSVGAAAGTEIAIMDEAGSHLPAGGSGEVVLKGPGLTRGYADNPEANQSSFTGGWFRTGDLGRLNEDGYLFLTGRIKEIVNRGGEKISPREVDEVLLEHRAVAQAAAFALPHPELGEDLAAAVVLRPGARTTEEDLRRHAAGRLALFKVPSRFFFLDEIPKGPTGKFNRIGLAGRLGLSPASTTKADAPETPAPLRDEIDRKIAGLWGQVLGRPELAVGLGLDTNFFFAGGSSLSAAVLIGKVQAELGVELPLVGFLRNPTIRFMADVVAGREPVVPAALVVIQPGEEKSPFFAVHDGEGRVIHLFRLAAHLGRSHPVYAFQFPEADRMRPGRLRIEDLAESYLGELLAVQPQGPYLIGGYCFGAVVAYELAVRLEAQGRRVALLALMDSYAPGHPRRSLPASASPKPILALLDHLGRLPAILQDNSHLGRRGRAIRLAQFALHRVRATAMLISRTKHGRSVPANVRPFLRLPGDSIQQPDGYHPAPYQGPAVLFRPTRGPLGFQHLADMGWGPLIKGGLTIENVPGYHRTLTGDRRVERLAAKLSKHLLWARERG